MAQLSAVYDSVDGANSNREDFHNIITRLTPTKTPLISNIGETDVTATNPKYQTDALPLPNENAERPEGDTYTFEAVAPTKQISSQTQIFSERFHVTRTQEDVNKAGKKSEKNEQRAKAMQKMKIDIEVATLSNRASVGGTTRVMAGLRAWTETNDDMGATGASGGYNDGTGQVVAATNGTQREFTKTILDNVKQQTHISGGDANILMVSPRVKRVFSSFMSDPAVAQQRRDANKDEQATIVGAADIYIGDFGPISVISNVQMARDPASTIARNAFLIDKSKLKMGWLHKVQEDKKVAHTGDAEPCVLNAEVTLLNYAESAHGVAADLFGLSPSS